MSNALGNTETLSDEDMARLALDPSYFMELYVMDADGANVRRLTDAPGYDGGPFWSADGSRITWRRFSENGVKAEIYTMAADGSDEKTPPPAPEVVESSLEDVDLREHMVGILFSRSKLTHLQKQVRPVFPLPASTTVVTCAVQIPQIILHVLHFGIPQYVYSIHVGLHSHCTSDSQGDTARARRVGERAVCAS